MMDGRKKSLLLVFSFEKDKLSSFFPFVYLSPEAGSSLILYLSPLPVRSPPKQIVDSSRSYLLCEICEESENDNFRRLCSGRSFPVVVQLLASLPRTQLILKQRVFTFASEANFPITN